MLPTSSSLLKLAFWTSLVVLSIGKASGKTLPDDYYGATPDLLDGYGSPPELSLYGSPDLPIIPRLGRPDPKKEGSIEIYKDYQWEVVKGSSSKDQELLSTEENILDLALVMDLTGSMGDWIENTKDTLIQVIDTVVEKNPELQVRVAFVGFRDFVDDEIFTVHDFTFDLENMKDFISNLRATGGGDLPEDVAGGIYQLLKLSWHPNSIKLANLVADAPSHGRQYHPESDESTYLGDDHPDGSPAGLTLTDLMRQVREKDISFTCYKLENSTEKMYSVIKEAYGEGGVFTFVDLRGILQQNQELGYHSATSDYVKHAYAHEVALDLDYRYSAST